MLRCLILCLGDGACSTPCSAGTIMNQHMNDAVGLLKQDAVGPHRPRSHYFCVDEADVARTRPVWRNYRILNENFSLLTDNALIQTQQRPVALIRWQKGFQKKCKSSTWEATPQRIWLAGPSWKDPTKWRPHWAPVPRRRGNAWP